MAHNTGQRMEGEDAGQWVHSHLPTITMEQALQGHSDEIHSQTLIINRIKANSMKLSWANFDSSLDIKKIHETLKTLKDQVGTLITEKFGVPPKEQPEEEGANLEFLKKLGEQLERRRLRNANHFEEQFKAQDEIRREQKRVHQMALEVVKQLKAQNAAPDPSSSDSYPIPILDIVKCEEGYENRKYKTEEQELVMTKPRKPSSRMVSRGRGGANIAAPNSSRVWTAGTHQLRRPRLIPEVRFLKSKRAKPKTRSIFSRNLPSNPAKPFMQIGDFKMEVPELPDETEETRTEGNDDEGQGEAQELSNSFGGMSIVIPMRTAPATETSVIPDARPIRSVSLGSGVNVTPTTPESCPPKPGTSSAPARMSDKPRKFKINIRPTPTQPAPAPQLASSNSFSKSVGNLSMSSLYDVQQDGGRPEAHLPRHSEPSPAATSKDTPSSILEDFDFLDSIPFQDL